MCPPCALVRISLMEKDIQMINRKRYPCVLAAMVVFLLFGAHGAAGEPAPAAVLADLQRFANRLLEHGRDKYGPEHTPLFVCQVSTDTHRIPPADTVLYGQGHRGGAGPTMNNLQFDSGLIRLLDGLSRLTGDPKYRSAVGEYLTYYLENLPDPKTGFFPWGDHRGYDVVKDETIDAVHEFKNIYPPWARLYEINPIAVTRQIESLKLHIYDRSRSWAFSRHYPSGGEIPHSMNSSGGAYIAAWSFLHQKTGEPKYREWAIRMADYFWSVRNRETDLLAAHPADPAYPQGSANERARLRASRTEYMGQLTTFAPNLLRAAELLGPRKGKRLCDQALAYIQAITERIDVQEDGSFHATFDLASGRPLFPRISAGWRFISQQDDRFPWANRVLGIRAPIMLAFAYKMTGEEELREAFDRFLPLYEMETFAAGAPRRELPAGLMAQALVSFLNMYQATGEKPYLEHARTLAAYARQHYFVDGWIVCGPPLLDRYQDDRVDTWRLYCNRGGSAELGLALLRLHLVISGQEDFVMDNPMGYF